MGNSFFHKPQLNTNGPLGNGGGFWSRLGNIGLRVGATGLGNAAGGPLGGAGVNAIWNKLWGTQGPQAPFNPNIWHNSGTSAQPPVNPLQMGSQGLSAVNGLFGNTGSNPFFGGFSSNPTNGLNLNSLGGFQNLMSGGVGPSVNGIGQVPLTSLGGFSGLNLNPSNPGSTSSGSKTSASASSFYSSVNPTNPFAGIPGYGTGYGSSGGIETNSANGPNPYDWNWWTNYLTQRG